MGKTSGPRGGSNGGDKSAKKGAAPGRAPTKGAAKAKAGAAAGVRAGAKTGARSGSTSRPARPGAPRPQPGTKKAAPGRPKTTPRTAAPAPAHRGPLEFSDRATQVLAVGVLLLALAYLPKVTSSSFPPENAVLLVLGAAGLPLLVARALGTPGTERARGETWAARCAVGFVVVGLVATFFAAKPLLSVFGLYVHLAGWLYLAALAGCWALGTAVSSRDRHWLELAIIGGALVNAVVAILQQLVGLDAVGIPDYSGIPDGLLSNPVFLAALLAGSLALVGPRFLETPRRWWPVALLVALALGMSGERLSALMALVVAGYLLWRARPRAAGTPEGAWRPALAFGALVAGSIVAGSVLARVVGGFGVVSRTVGSNSNGTFGQRFEFWRLAARAIASRPLVGYGPDQFRTATSPLVPASFARSNGAGTSFVFLDAHNIVIEYATTIGLIGGALLVAWLVLTARRRRGPLLGFALVLLVVGLAEPVSLVVTPLMFLGFGAATLVATAGDPAGEAATRGPGAPRAGVAPGAVAPGDHRGPRHRGRRPGPRALGRGLLLPGRPDPGLDVDQRGAQPGEDRQLGALRLARAGHRERQPLRLAGRRRRLGVAPARRPLGHGGHPTATRPTGCSGPPWPTSNWSSARRRARTAARARAVHFEPWNTTALNLLGTQAAQGRDNARAAYWFARSLAVDPTQPQVRGYLAQLHRGCHARATLTRSGALVFSCPR